MKVKNIFNFFFLKGRYYFKYKINNIIIRLLRAKQALCSLCRRCAGLGWASCRPRLSLDLTPSPPAQTFTSLMQSTAFRVEPW